VAFGVINSVMLVRGLVEIRTWLQKWSRKTHRQHGGVSILRFVSFNKESRLKTYSGFQNGTADYPKK